MGSIKRGGVVAGGAVAAAILTASGVALAQLTGLVELAAATGDGEAPGILIPLAMRAATGFVVVWVYVAFRPRFGAGRRAIVGAATAVWMVTSAAVLSFAALFQVASVLTVALIVVWSLIDLTTASLAGAGVYRRYLGLTTRRRGRNIDADVVA